MANKLQFQLPDFAKYLLIACGIVALIGCYKGMNCSDGAEGVGRATTESVVYSSITILIANFFLTLSLGAIVHSL